MKALVSLITCLLLLTNCTQSSSDSPSPTPATTDNSAQGTGAVVLPDSVMGNFTGTLIVEGPAGMDVRQNVIATVSKLNKLVSIQFSGMSPALQNPVPNFQDLLFQVTEGSQIGVYESIQAETSVEGIHLSEYRTNLNIVEVTLGTIKVSYTGTK